MSATPNSLTCQIALSWKNDDEETDCDASNLCSSKCPNAVQEHPGGPTVVLLGR
jgi:hypothetical protein